MIAGDVEWTEILNSPGLSWVVSLDHGVRHRGGGKLMWLKRCKVEVCMVSRKVAGASEVLFLIAMVDKGAPGTMLSCSDSVPGIRAAIGRGVELVC